ncbi:F0F1 ATP synthase subunit delta [Mariniluteicoccus flavus]
MSRTSAANESRLGVLDRVLDSQEPHSTLAGELFAVVDAMDAQPVLRRSLTDPGMPADQRKGLVYQLLNGKVSGSAVYIVEEAAAQRWMGGRSLADALERQGVRAELRAAMAEGKLDEVTDELFRFERTIAAESELRAALANRTFPVEGRVELVTRLLDGRAHEATVVLARRAVSARERTVADTLEGYLKLASDMRNRGVATVRVARPLDHDQHERLRQALSRQVGRDLDMHVIVDPRVLGGVRVELGDEVIEGTVEGRLETARRAFQ